MNENKSWEETIDKVVEEISQSVDKTLETHIVSLISKGKPTHKKYIPNVLPASIQYIIKPIISKLLIKEKREWDHEQEIQVNTILETKKREWREKIERLRIKNQEEACVICQAPEYDEVKMTRFIENPFIKGLVYAHMDFIRELNQLLEE